MKKFLAATLALLMLSACVFAPGGGYRHGGYGGGYHSHYRR